MKGKQKKKKKGDLLQERKKLTVDYDCSVYVLWGSQAYRKRMNRRCCVAYMYYMVIRNRTVMDEERIGECVFWILIGYIKKKS